MDNFEADFDIPVEVYKRFGLPAQYLYGASSALNGESVRNQFTTKRSMGEQNVLLKIKDAVDHWADQYK